NRWMLTPLALVLIVIDVMDLVFAVDSIPAVFAITRDAFIVYTSNICAIVGLRSLYFLLANLIDRFVYLNTGLAIVLAFIGIKMGPRANGAVVSQISSSRLRKSSSTSTRSTKRRGIMLRSVMAWCAASTAVLQDASQG